MKFKKERNTLLGLFLGLGIAFFFIMNFGHWVTYKPLISRIDRVVTQAFKNESIDFFTSIDHNASTEEVNMIRLSSYPEGFPLMLESEARLEELTTACKLSKAANSYTLHFDCPNNQLNFTLKNLNNYAWTGAMKYAIISMLIIWLIGFFTSRKLSDEKLEQIWV